MLKVVVFAAVTALACGAAAWAQPPTDELGAQLRMEQWTFWMMVTGAASAVFAFLGFVGVMLTLREQRRLTVAQERSIIELLGWSMSIDEFTVTEDGEGLLQETSWIITVGFKNTGRTHATNVQLKALVKITPPGLPAPWLVGQGKFSKETAVSQKMDQLAPGAEGQLAGVETSKILINHVMRRKDDWTKSAHQMAVELTLSFVDVFGSKHETTFRDTVGLMHTDYTYAVGSLSRAGGGISQSNQPPA